MEGFESRLKSISGGDSSRSITVSQRTLTCGMAMIQRAEGD